MHGSYIMTVYSTLHVFVCIMTYWSCDSSCFNAFTFSYDSFYASTGGFLLVMLGEYSFLFSFSYYKKILLCCHITVWSMISFFFYLCFCNVLLVYTLILLIFYMFLFNLSLTQFVQVFLSQQLAPCLPEETFTC